MQKGPVEELGVTASLGVPPSLSCHGQTEVWLEPGGSAL